MYFWRSSLCSSRYTFCSWKLSVQRWKEHNAMKCKQCQQQTACGLEAKTPSFWQVRFNSSHEISSHTYATLPFQQEQIDEKFYREYSYKKEKRIYDEAFCVAADAPFGLGHHQCSVRKVITQRWRNKKCKRYRQRVLTTVLWKRN